MSQYCSGLRFRLLLVVVLASIHTVGVATSEEALKLAQRRKFDVVLSDINRWPGMNGLDFLKVSKQSNPRVPVIIASGVLDEATARQARWLRAFDCLPKPFACHEIITMARSALASRRMCRTVLRSCSSSRWK